MLDIKILIISSFFSLIILIIISLFLWYKLPQEKYPKYFALFSIIFLIGQMLTSSRNVIPDWLSIVIGNTLLCLGYMFLYVGIGNLLNLNAKWHNRYFLPIGVLLLGFILFTYVHYNVAMRIVIFSIFCVIYGSIVGWLFWKNARKGFKTLDNISAFLFFIGVIMFSIRTIKASTIKIPANYLSTTDLMITLVYVYLFFITIWLSFILIINAIKIPLDKKALKSKT
ncbi:MAG: hypothetical protein WCR78_03170 [Arcobacteraceae bacterium]